MAVRIKVINYQSIAKAELEVDGFTAVTGPNNSGKTALMRAVQGAFTNAPGKSFIRKGQEKTAVAVKFEDGKSVLWAKGTKLKPTYRINGGEAINPGRQVPEELADLGVNSIRLGDRELWPSIAQQMSGQVFLLDLSGSALAEAVADVERVGKLNKSLRLVEGDRRSKGATLKVRKADVQKAEADLATYEGLDAVEQQIQELSAQQDRVLNLRRKLEYVKGLKTRLEGASAEVDRLRQVEDVVLPELDTLTKVKDKLSMVVPLRTGLDKAKSEVIRLSPVENVQVPGGEELPKLQQKLKAANDLKERLTSLLREVRRLTGNDVPSLDGIDTKAAERLGAGLKKVRSLQETRTEAQDQITLIQDEIKATEKERDQLVHETHDLLGDLQECPTCEQHWSPA